MSDAPVHLGNVCTVIDSLRTGGAERLVVTVHKYLASEVGVTPAIVTLYPGGLFEEEACAAGARIVSLGDLGKITALTWIRRFREFLLCEKPDTVHGHLFPVNYLLWAATLGMQRPPEIVFTEHNVYNRRRDFWPFRPIERVVYSKFSRVICVSEEVRSSLVEWLPSVESKAVVIRNCIEVPPMSEREWLGRSWDCVAVGSLTAQKGFEILIDAVGLLREAGALIQVAIAGEGPLRCDLESQVREQGLAEEVHFLGTVKDIEGLLADSKIFVMPSEYEGFPMAILEAMAAGLPVVATRVGGLPEVVQHGLTGFLVERGGSEELAGAVATLLNHEDMAQDFGKQGRRWVETEVSVRKHVDTLSEVFSCLGTVRSTG